MNFAIIDLPRRSRPLVVILLLATGALLWLASAASAQQACVPDAEPNDSPEQAQAVGGAFCIDGSIGDTDQEILAWSVDAEASLRPWTISLSGPAGLQTRLQIHRLEEPAADGNPAVVGPELAVLVTPNGANSVSRANLFLTPGTWLVGISVSAGDGGAYQVTFAPGEPPATAGLTPENATAQGALPVANAFALQGLLAKPDAWYLWQLSPVDARKRWTLSANAPLGAAVGFDLQTTDGKPLLAATRISEGQLLLPDIGLPPGSYRIHLRCEDGISYPFSLNSVAQGPRSPGREEEPNDSALTARPVTLGQAMTGRISQPGDVDTYVLPAAAAGQLLGIVIGGESKAITRLCVGGSDGALLQCRESAAPQLDDIVLGNSARFVTVSGAASPGATYDLTARGTGKVLPDGEAEPNDTLATANVLTGASARGRMSGSDTDTYRFEVNDTNLRQFTVTGDAVESIEVVNSQNQSSARADRQMDADAKLLPGPLVLTDLALQPGTYFLFVSGRAKGEYTIASNVTAPTPAAANTVRESEPNDAVEQAQLLSEGERLSAQLGSPGAQYGETDYYRLSLASAGGIALHIDPEQDCGFDVEVRWDSWSGAIPRMAAKQKGFVYEALLDAGGYTVRVQPAMGCDTLIIPYTIGYDAAPDLLDVGDVEPNDAFNTGRALSPDLKVSGTVGQYSDADWFRLPALDADAEVTLTATGAVEVALTDGKATSSFQMSLPTDIAVGDASAPVKGTVAAGTSAAIRVTGSGPYMLEVTVAGQAVAAVPVTRPSATPASGMALSASLKLADNKIAAFWHRGQRLAGTLTLANSGATPVEAGIAPATVPAGWRFEFPTSVMVESGKTETVPLALEIEPDVYAARTIRLAVAVSAGEAGAFAVNADVAAEIAAPPVGDHLAFGLPESLRGGFNVAWSSLGGTLEPNDKVSEAEYPQTINDGLGSNAGFLADAAKLPLDFTIRFGGDKAWPIRGITLNPQTPGIWPSEYIQDFELLLSADGQTFTSALKGRVGTEPREQIFLLPQATEARAAQLRVFSNHDGNLGRVGFSEWKVIADPAAGLGVGLDIADTLRGGHIVWSQPMISDQVPVIKGVLEAGGNGAIVKLSAGTKPQFTVGFNEDRAAQIAAVEWTDAAPAELARLIPAVLVEASTETALGPWISLGEWSLQGEGRSTKTFERPVWARFLRFTSLEAAPEDATQVQYPSGLRIEERATDAGYRSILGEWGQYSPDGFYETTLPAAVEARPEGGDNNTRETAEALAIDETVSGRVEIVKDEDWYRVVQPDGLDLLAIMLSGEPTVGADVNLVDEAGRLVALNEAGGSPRQTELEARVEPGKKYYLRVSQPPHSVVIAYDTSGSLLAFIPIIYNALQVFAAGVTPGQEAVNFLPFDRTPMLRDFSDQPAILKQALAKDSRESTTSGLEGSAITAMRELATRRGTRALLVITDGASSTIASQTDMWTMIGQVRPRIFAAHTGSFDDPLREKQLLQDLALASGGHYTSSRSQAEVDVAFDRVAAWLRRPAGYSLRVAARKAVPPEPGALEISEGAPAAANTEAYAEPASGSAIEIVLDASGSMLKRLGGKRRIEIARNSLNRLVTEKLKRDDPVALRVFGNDRPGSCETSLVQPLGPLDPEATTATVSSIMPQNLAKTPIAASLRMVGDDLASANGRKTVILLTDGEETCGGDPRAEIAALAERDIEVRVNIVGFAVDDPALKGEFAEWARIGRGRYFDATKPEELDAAVKAATELPYSVIDSTGAAVASGTVGGAAVSLQAGEYRVEIASTPPQVLEGVLIQEKRTTRIEADAS